MIACINIGLLGKQSDKAKKSILFSKMVDAFYYQEKYGGDISIITETTYDRYFNDGYDDDDDDDDDMLIERDEMGNDIENIEDDNGNDIPEKIDECKHYVLNISDKKL